MKNTILYTINTMNDKLLKWYKMPISYLSLAASSVTSEINDDFNFNKISKNAMILAMHIFFEIDKQNAYCLFIDNINELSSEFEWTVEETKKYLYELANWSEIYQDISSFNVLFYNISMFNVYIHYKEKDTYNYNFDKLLIISSPECEFYKNETFKQIEITPNFSFIENFNNGQEKYIFVSNKIISLAKKLTNLEYKLLCYSASNEQFHEITEDKLFESLNLAKQVTKENKLIMREKIAKAFQTLQNKNHIKRFSIKEQKNTFNEILYVYSYTCTDKYVKFKEKINS